jgi:hypothetical protein
LRQRQSFSRMLLSQKSKTSRITSPIAQLAVKDGPVRMNFSEAPLSDALLLGAVQVCATTLPYPLFFAVLYLSLFLCTIYIFGSRIMYQLLAICGHACARRGLACLAHALCGCFFGLFLRTLGFQLGGLILLNFPNYSVRCAKRTSAAVSLERRRREPAGAVTLE